MLSGIFIKGFIVTEKDESHLVDELKRQLREKDLVLTDIRLEALSSAHQLESLKDTVIKMRVSLNFYCYVLANGVPDNKLL